MPFESSVDLMQFDTVVAIKSENLVDDRLSQ